MGQLGMTTRGVTARLWATFLELLYVTIKMVAVAAVVLVVLDMVGVAILSLTS